MMIPPYIVRNKINDARTLLSIFGTDDAQLIFMGDAKNSVEPESILNGAGYNRVEIGTVNFATIRLVKFL